MSGTDQQGTHFRSDPEMPELDEYRPLSSLAVGACIFSLLSVVAVFHPILWVLPVAATVLAFGAIIRLSIPDSRTSGKPAACVALCFAVLVGSYAPAKAISHDRAMFAESKSKVEAWLSLLQQGRVQEAHQLSLDDSKRFRGPGTLSEFYTGKLTKNSAIGGNEPTSDMLELQQPAEELKNFVNLPVVAKILSYGDQSRIEHIRNIEITSVYNGLRATQEFRVHGVVDGQPEHVTFRIVASRTVVDQLAEWQVGSLVTSE